MSSGPPNGGRRTRRHSASTTTINIEVPFDPHFIARLIPALLEGAEVTVELAALTMVICLFWGLLVALAHGARGPLGWVAGGYIQVVRNTPLLIPVYLVYFGFLMG